ncbi:MAG: HDIG domain-containing protein [Anaerolineales bacterium]|nr:HDIG domain-containing protein [Anaerolineales bacterium]
MHSLPGSTSPQRLRKSIHDLRLPLFAVFLTLSLTLILSIDLLRAEQVDVVVGQPAQEDIFAPETYTFISKIQTTQARNIASNNVPDVYTPLDISIGRAQLAQVDAIFNFIDTVRADSQANLDQKITYIQSIEGLTVAETVAYDLVTMNQDDYAGARAEIMRIVDDLMREDIRESQLDEFQRLSRRSASLGLTSAQSSVVTNIVGQFIVPTVFFDEEATLENREAAGAAVEPVPRSVAKDQRIVRAGEIISEADYELMVELGLLRQATGWYYVASNFLIAIVFVVLIVLYWQLYRDPLEDNGRYLILLAGLILFYALTAKMLTTSSISTLKLLFPIASLAMLIAVIFDVRFSILITITIAGIFAFSAHSSLEMGIYATVGGLLASLTLRDAQRLVAYFQAGLIAAVGQIAVLAIFALTAQLELIGFLQSSLYALGNGVLSAALTLAGFYILGGLFGIITSLQLQDLSRLDHPLLQELLRRAPGTYHHSIMVANLAEQAAERVKANSTLVRVGAFYHDIGKMNRPAFFTENQEGLNPHDSLDAYTSARIIVAHVPDGVELAKRYRLPDRIRDFIAEHHGTRLVKGFYFKAQEEADEEADQVNPDQFRYPGPRPRSRETGIVMLADAVEATSSAIRPNNPAAIEKLVNSLVNEDVREGQLNNSGLSMGDVEKIRLSFIETLKGRFHVRVKYPGNEALEEGSKAGKALPAPDTVLDVTASLPLNPAQAKPSLPRTRDLS